MMESRFQLPEDDRVCGVKSFIIQPHKRPAAYCRIGKWLRAKVTVASMLDWTFGKRYHALVLSHQGGRVNAAMTKCNDIRKER